MRKLIAGLLVVLALWTAAVPAAGAQTPNEIKDFVVSGGSRETPFTDVTDTGETGKNASVAYVYDTGLMTGVSDTLFRPKKNMSRAMTVTVLHRAMSSPQVTQEMLDQVRFRDVKPSAYYYPAMCWATDLGIVKGTSRTTFSPDALITREQFVTLLYRLVCSLGRENELPIVDAPDFADKDRVSVYAREAVSWACRHGILQGRNVNGAFYLYPSDEIQRIEAAHLLYRTLQPLSLPIQAMNGSTRGRRNSYPNLTDEEFANFRYVKGGSIKAKTLYRSSTPITGDIGRNHQSMTAAEKAGIKTFVNFVNSEEDALSRRSQYNEYYFKQNVVYCPVPNSKYTSAEFKAGLCAALRYMAQHSGPYLLHCTEGKDRTGVACAILEALMGASYREIYDDYVKSHENLYSVVDGGVQIPLTPGQYKKLDRTLSYYLTLLLFNEKPAAGTVPKCKTGNLSAAAKQYLLSIGLTEGEIQALIRNMK